MSLSARQDPLFGRAGAGEFSPAALAAVLQAGAPEIAFAHLLGSARDGKLAAGADVDLAVEHEDFRWRLEQYRRLRRELRLAAAG